METTVPSCVSGDHSIVDVHLADGNAAAGSTAAGELQRTDAAGSSAAGQLQRTESSADDKWKQLKSLINIVFYIEFLEYLGNAIGTVAFLWATVVLLGGFCSLLSRLDFWFATIMVFLEGTRVFIGKDTSVNQWLFGSTRAFRWDHFCFPKMRACGNLIAVIIGAGISLAPIEIGSQIITGILKVALLAITSLLLTRRHWGWFVKTVLSLLCLASFGGALYAFGKMMPHTEFTGFSGLFSRATLRNALLSLKLCGLVFGWFCGTLAAACVIAIIMAVVSFCGQLLVIFFKVIVALSLIPFPFLHAKLSSKPIYLGLSMASALAFVTLDLLNDIRSSPPKAPPADKNNSSSSPKAPPADQNNTSSSPEVPPADENNSSSSPEAPQVEHDNSSSSPQAHQKQKQNNALLLPTRKLLSEIVDTIMPILFFWTALFPLPGIPLKVSFYMLFSVIAAVLVGNLQIPVAFLQILLSSLRLQSLLAGRHSHRDYNPLPDGASPNLVPSIVVFFVLELCQGSSNILGVILGLFSFHRRRSLVHVLRLNKEEWGAKAVNLYYHQAFMTIKEKGLFPMEKSPPPSLDSFAVQSLGCTSSEMQIVRLQVLDYYLQQGDSKSKSRLIAQIAKDAPGIVTKITGTISHLITDEEKLSSGLKLKLKKKKQKQIRSSLSLCLNFLWRLAMAGGKIGTRFRRELSGNPILLHSIQRILDLEVCPQELWKPTMDVIKLLALQDEATAKEIGSTHAVIPKLMGVFLVQGHVTNLRDNQDGSLRKAAGEVLEKLTITNSDNCRVILDMEAGPGRHDLIKNLINMLKDDNYMSIAANLLHNLCANSGDKLANEDLKSSLQLVMQIIIGNGNDKQLDAALCVASQIGYMIPKEDFALVLAENNLSPNTGTAAELVGKLVDTLKSNIEPNREFPRLRRSVIGTVISIMESCPGYIEIFRGKEAKDALNKLKGTSSKLEKFKVFIEGEGMVKSTPMHKLVCEAKTKLQPQTNPI